MELNFSQLVVTDYFVMKSGKFANYLLRKASGNSAYKAHLIDSASHQIAIEYDEIPIPLDEIVIPVKKS